MDQIHVGVDAAKDRLDLHQPGHGHARLANTASAARGLARKALRDGLWVIFEASGGYDRNAGPVKSFHLPVEAVESCPGTVADHLALNDDAGVAHDPCAHCRAVDGTLDQAAPCQ